ncbi:hypothetical protein UT300019_09030 [Clostridium sp. CTA-19]
MEILVKGFSQGAGTFGSMCTCDCNCNCNCNSDGILGQLQGDIECVRKWGFRGCGDCGRYTPRK